MFNFMKYNKIMIVISTLLVIASLFLITSKGFQFGIDFKGGTLTELNFKENIETDTIKDYLKKEFKEITVIHYGSSNKILIQTELDKDYQNIGKKIFEEIKKHEKDVNLVRTEFIGPKIGDELKTKGVLSLLIVAISILVYVTFSFEFKFSVGAIIALCHDLIISAGFISLMEINIDLNVLAAMLAILGYSLNDTIIVYDRVRENINNEEEINSISETINKSINETLSRTIMTSLTTSVTLIALLIWGGESLSSFSMILLFGIIIGTYSSIYIASGLLNTLKINKKEKDLVEISKENGVL